MEKGSIIPALEKAHTNWRTTAFGWVALIAGGIAMKPELVDFLPEEWRRWVVGIAGLIAFLSGGAFATVAKDSAVTGGKVRQPGPVFPREAGQREVDNLP